MKPVFSSDIEYSIETKKVCFSGKKPAGRLAGKRGAPGPNLVRGAGRFTVLLRVPRRRRCAGPARHRDAWRASYRHVPGAAATMAAVATAIATADVYPPARAGHWRWGAWNVEAGRG